MQELPVPRTLFGGAVAMKARISLVDELDALAGVIESAQLLAELLATNGLPDDDSAKRAPRLLETVLAMAQGRIRLLRKVVLEEADVSLLLGRHNRAFGNGSGDDPDVRLSASMLRRRRR